MRLLLRGVGAIAMCCVIVTIGCCIADAADPKPAPIPASPGAGAYSDLLKTLGHHRVLWQVSDGQCSSAMLMNSSTGEPLWQRLPIGTEQRQDWRDATVLHSTLLFTRKQEPLLEAVNTHTGALRYVWPHRITPAWLSMLLPDDWLPDWTGRTAGLPRGSRLMGPHADLDKLILSSRGSAKGASATVFAVDARAGVRLWRADVAVAAAAVAKEEGLDASGEPTITSVFVDDPGAVVALPMRDHTGTNGGEAVGSSSSTRGSSSRGRGSSGSSGGSSGGGYQGASSGRDGAASGLGKGAEDYGDLPEGDAWGLATELWVANGTARWTSSSLSPSPLWVAGTTERIAVVVSEPGPDDGSALVYGIDRDTGDVVWQTSCMHADCHADILDTSMLLLHGDPLTLESMRTVDLDTGKLLWRPSPPRRASRRLDDEPKFEAGQVCAYSIRLRDGRLKWEAVVAEAKDGDGIPPEAMEYMQEPLVLADSVVVALRYSVVSVQRTLAAASGSGAGDSGGGSGGGSDGASSGRGSGTQLHVGAGGVGNRRSLATQGRGGSGGDGVDAVTSEQATSEQATAEQATSEQATSEQSASEQATSEQAASEQATAEQATSEQATSEQATSEQATSEQTTLKQAASEQATAEQAASEAGATTNERLQRGGRVDAGGASGGSGGVGDGDTGGGAGSDGAAGGGVATSDRATGGATTERLERGGHVDGEVLWTWRVPENMVIEAWFKLDFHTGVLLLRLTEEESSKGGGGKAGPGGDAGDKACMLVALEPTQGTLLWSAPLGPTWRPAEQQLLPIAYDEPGLVIIDRCATRAATPNLPPVSSGGSSGSRNSSASASTSSTGSSSSSASTSGTGTNAGDGRGRGAGASGGPRDRAVGSGADWHALVRIGAGRRQLAGERWWGDDSDGGGARSSGGAGAGAAGAGAGAGGDGGGASSGGGAGAGAGAGGDGVGGLSLGTRHRHADDSECCLDALNLDDGSLAWSYCFDHSARCREHAGLVNALEDLAMAASACIALLTVAGVALCVRRCVRRRRRRGAREEGAGNAGGVGAPLLGGTAAAAAGAAGRGAPGEEGAGGGVGSAGGVGAPLLGAVAAAAAVAGAAGRDVSGEEGPQLCLVDDGFRLHNDDDTPPDLASKESS
ncbi:hypothetical protein FOA52_003362 [Chlamydomonas sp. UWO 241]|nr:hypothetical protein FOA52_003362 [Chlamydomonas sp. UWO 241]